MSARETEILDRIAAATEQILVRLTAIASTSGDVGGLAAMAEALAEELRRRGFQVAVEPRAGDGGLLLPVLCARRGSTGAPPLLLIGHLDTVLPARPPRFAGHRIYASGAIDMKGGFAALLGALDLLAERQAQLPDDLLLLAVPDEEVGGTLSSWAVAEYGAAARALWVLEPGEPDDDGETCVGGRRGLFQWRLSASGRSAHSGLHFWHGRSALAAAAEWSVAAAALSAPGDGPTVNVSRLLAGDADFVDRLAQEHLLVGTAQRLNVVPDRALVEGEARFLAVAEAEALEAALREAAETIGSRREVALRFEVGARIPPVEPLPSRRAWLEAAVAAAAARGWRLGVETHRGGISFPNFLPEGSVIPVLDGLGPVGGGMHTVEEFVDRTSLRRRVVLLADLLEREAAGR